MGGDPHQNVFGSGLGVLHFHVEVPVAVEDPSVDQLVLGIELSPPSVRLGQIGVRIGGLRILVEHPQVGRRRRRVEVVVALLDVLAVVALGVGEAEHPLLEDRILSVPECQCQAEHLPIVAEAGNAILAPAVRPGTRLLVGEVGPGVAAVAVVLAHRPPLPLTQVRSPASPRHARSVGLFQSVLLRVSHDGILIRSPSRRIVR
jgi:hypothetical protein